MKVRPVMGDFEIPHVAAIETLERRDFVELRVPGRAGSLFHDIDAHPARIAISGSVFGDDDRETFLKEVRTRFQTGEPITFVADIVTATEVQYVVIESFAVEETGTRPDQLAFQIALRESPPPPPPGSPLGDLDAGLLDQAASFVDSIAGAAGLVDMLAGAIDALGSVPDFANPMPPLSGALDAVTSATSGLDAAAGPLRDAIGGDGG
jgi:hypothetical protein